MIFAPALRKWVLAIHIAVSVGWIGAVLAYLALDATTVTSDDASTLRAAYVGMEVVALRVIVPLALAAFVTGILISLGTRWGLFRHYWVIFSLVLTILAVAVLLVETQTISALADKARDPATSDATLRAMPSTRPHSIGGAIVLFLVLALNLWKPRGVTPYGWRKQQAEASGGGAADRASP